MHNIGLVIYKKDHENGNLNATWCHSNGQQGTGVATGGPLIGFEGVYDIQYFDSEGKLDAELRLQIVKQENLYFSKWINKGEVTSTGIGMEVDGTLAIGWT